MIVVTTPLVDGKQTVTVLGLVRGNTVRARHVGRDFLVGLRNVVGGKVDQYSRLLTESREQALSRIVQQAEGLGANAVVNLRSATSMIRGSTPEILTYGTAVVVEE